MSVLLLHATIIGLYFVGPYFGRFKTCPKLGPMKFVPSKIRVRKSMCFSIDKVCESSKLGPSKVRAVQKLGQSKSSLGLN